MAGGASRMLSSLPLQVLLYFNGWFVLLYVVLELLEYIYKGTRLPYPDAVLGLEIFGIAMIALIEPCRLVLGSRGNKTEAVVPLVWQCGLSLPLFGAYLYYLNFQAYVLRLDQVLNVIAILFIALDFVFALVAALVFWHNRRR